MHLVGQHYPGDYNRAVAVYFRLQALARVVATAEGARWSLPRLADGGVPIRSEVIAVAASHPLAQVGNSVGFDLSSFFARVQEVAEAEGNS
jgi:hypothetical protein